ncbi:MAG: hypothetical protein WC626_01395 [Methanoregula sp.]
MNAKSKILLVIITASFFIVLPASAYWDAGTLTLIWQAFAALAIAILYIIKSKWYQLKQFFKKKESKQY